MADTASKSHFSEKKKVHSGFQRRGIANTF